MTVKIQEFKVAKRRLENSLSWAEMLGKRYEGGGGGNGDIRYCRLATGSMASPTIYYQHSNGAQNYHMAPDELIPYIEGAIKAHFKTLLDYALSRQEADVQALAKAAVEEHNELLREAGFAR